MADNESMTTAFRILMRAYPDHVNRHLRAVARAGAGAPPAGASVRGVSLQVDGGRMKSI